MARRRAVPPPVDLGDKVILVAGRECLRRAWVDVWVAECGAIRWYFVDQTLFIRYGTAAHETEVRVEPLHIKGRGLFYPIDMLR